MCTAKKDVAVQWNLYLGDTLGTKASVPLTEVGLGIFNN